MPGIVLPPSQEAGLFQGKVFTLCSSLGVPSGLVPLPLEAQEAKARRRGGRRRRGSDFLIIQNQYTTWSPTSIAVAGVPGRTSATEVWASTVTVLILPTIFSPR